MSQIEFHKRPSVSRNFAIPAAAMFPAAERLVGLGFRCWLAGLPDERHRLLGGRLAPVLARVGPRAAKPLMTELACWVRAVQDTAERRIEVYPAQCRRFCRDECLAISMVAACQHSACPAFRACAVALLGCNDVDEAIEGAEGFARCLKEADQILSPGTVFMGAGSRSRRACSGRC